MQYKKKLAGLLGMQDLKVPVISCLRWHVHSDINNSSKHNQLFLLLTYRSLSETFIIRRSWDTSSEDRYVNNVRIIGCVLVNFQYQTSTNQMNLFSEIHSDADWRCTQLFSRLFCASATVCSVYVVFRRRDADAARAAGQVPATRRRRRRQIRDEVSATQQQRDDVTGRIQRLAELTARTAGRSELARLVLQQTAQHRPRMYGTHSLLVWSGRQGGTGVLLAR